MKTLLSLLFILMISNTNALFDNNENQLICESNDGLIVFIEMSSIQMFGSYIINNGSIVSMEPLDIIHNDKTESKLFYTNSDKFSYTLWSLNYFPKKGEADLVIEDKEIGNKLSNNNINSLQCKETSRINLYDLI